MSKESHRKSKKGRSEWQILEFCMLVNSFFEREIIIKNPHKKYENLLFYLSKNEQKMVNNLIYHLTKLYQNHRVRIGRDAVEVAEEDILVALKIVENLKILETHNNKKLEKSDREKYLKVRDYFKNKVFTSNELEEFLQLKNSSVNLFLNVLVENNLVERFGFRNRKYYYKLLEIKELSYFESSEDNEENDEDDITKEVASEFSDNRRYYKYE